jgi:hypothetical protein
MFRKAPWRAFEKELMRSERLSLEQKYRILDAMYAEAVSLGAFPPLDPLEDLGRVCRFAKAVNGVSGTA